jgi:glutathione S-transferase
LLLPAANKAAVLSWVELEEATLRPAVYTAQAGNLQQALGTIAIAVKSQKYLVGDSLTLADVGSHCGRLASGSLQLLTRIAGGCVLHAAACSGG